MEIDERKGAYEMGLKSDENEEKYIMLKQGMKQEETEIREAK
jgi:hypothetical protein